MTIDKKNSNNFRLCSNIYEFTLKKKLLHLLYLIIYGDFGY